MQWPNCMIFVVEDSGAIHHKFYIHHCFTCFYYTGGKEVTSD